MILTDREMDLLLQISTTIMATSDMMLFDEYKNTTAKHVRGFIKSFAKYSEDDKVIFVYLVMKHVLSKFD